MWLGLTVVLTVGAVIAIRRRYWPAVLYSAGVTILLLGICAIVVASWGWVAWTPQQMDMTQTVLVAESIVFAAAMASRVRLLRRSEQALTVRTQELVEALGTDALTGAANRAGLTSHGEAAVRAGDSGRSPLDVTRRTDGMYIFRIMTTSSDAAHTELVFDQDELDAFHDGVFNHEFDHV